MIHERPSDLCSALIQELHVTLGRLGLALGLARDAFAWIDQQGHIVWCNAALDALTGRDHLAVLGAPLWDVLALQQDGAPVTGDAYPARRVLAHGGDVDERYEVMLGERQVILEVFGRRGLIEGEPAALLVMHDVTEATRAHAELEALNAKLEAANAELEAFSYSVSHDLRTPLRAIDGFSQALLEDYAPLLEAEGKDFLQRLRTAAQHMGRLIEDLLRLSRVTRGELQWSHVDLTAMCRSIAADLAAADPGRDVELVIADGLSAQGDERLLRQVIENLLSNAYKFTSRTLHPRIEVGTMGDEREGQRTFFIRDNGAGFDMARADKLFGAFQRLHTVEEFPGTGIGLAIVRRIIHRHGGRIWAEAAVGQGATFYFTLPTAKAGTS
jgi:signal transduction histidine kinase